ncbi:MAG: hypothetical protein WDN44_02835 [Sphingomonas sp.]
MPFTTDMLTSNYKEEAVRYSLSASLIGVGIAALAALVASVFLPGEYRAAEPGEDL